MKLAERLQAAVNADKVEIWDRDGEKANLDKASLSELLARSPDLTGLKLDYRQSGDGIHSLDGEDYVFKGQVFVKVRGKKHSYYLKFFFWRKDDPRGQQGIEVQSFRKEK